MEGRRLKYLMRKRGIEYEAPQQQADDVAGGPMCLRGWTNREDEDFSHSKRRHATKDEKRKWTEIKMLAIYDDKDSIERILSHETDKHPGLIQRLLSMLDERGQPCIFYALESRSCKALKCLLDYSEDEDCVVAANGESLLHAATKIGCPVMIRVLMERDLIRRLVNHKENECGKTALHLAVELNLVEVAKELLLHGAKLDIQDASGGTPIFTAASKGHSTVLEFFLKHGNTSVQTLMLDSSLYSSRFTSLLQVAVHSGDQRTVHVCLDQDVQIVRKCLREEIERGAGFLIHLVCTTGMEECLVKIVEAMKDLELVQFNKRDRLGFTPMHKAATNNHAHLVKYLGSISRSFVNQATEHSQTALLLAAKLGNIAVIEELLNLDADVRISDASDRTVLHHGIRNPDILRMLLKRNEFARQLLNAKEKDGFTPVHVAAYKGLYESLTVLLEYEADTGVFTNTSRSPLHCAVTSQCVDVVQLVLSNEPALVNKADATGKTPLHTAASYGSTEIVKSLLDCGALIVRDSNMFSALHIAAQKGNLGIVELLVTFDRNILDWKDKYGRTALIGAASTGKTSVVKFLLLSGAAITEDHEFLNCLDWCFIMNDRDTAMEMMCDSRWKEIMMTARHGPEGSMAKLVYKMPKVACRVLSNSMSSRGHQDSTEHVKCYDFFCLVESPQGSKKFEKLKPMTAIDAMVRTDCHRCLCHPVCRKFLKSKWMEFGWWIHSLSLVLYIIFLVALNSYAFQIPSYRKTQINQGQEYEASLDIEVSMVLCLIFAGIHVVKEFTQLICYKHRYFLDPVNYLECVMYVCVFIFAVPVDQKMAVKTSLQWKACSLALLLAWVNLVLYLRRFGSYGIYILMMKKICFTLMKVLSLLIFFFFAFAAAFTVILNDRQGFTSFGLSMLTSVVMTMGEFEFKETFLDEVRQEYETFYSLRLALLVMFLILMPVILMNMLLALAIGDTNSILQKARLTKHVQMAKMIIDLESMRASLPWGKEPSGVAVLEEQPNKPVHILRSMWEYLFYGPEFTSDEDSREGPREIPAANEKVEEKLGMIVDAIRDIKQQIVSLEQKLSERDSERIPCERPSHYEGRHAGRQFRGSNGSFQYKSSHTETDSLGRRDDWTQVRRNSRASPWHFSRNDSSQAGDVFLTAEEDVKAEKRREEKENDPQLLELKEVA